MERNSAKFFAQLFFIFFTLAPPFLVRASGAVVLKVAQVPSTELRGHGVSVVNDCAYIDRTTWTLSENLKASHRF